MGKKVVKTIQKEVTVNICDTCGKEVEWNDTIEITADWSKRCPYDTCFDDWGSFNFCSYECFKDGTNKILDEISADEDFFAQRLSLTVSGTGKEDKTLPNLLKALRGSDE